LKKGTMFESTNALIAALIAVMRDLRRCERLLAGGLLPDSEEEEIGPLVDQLHEAIADLSDAYVTRQAEHPNLLSLEELTAKIAAEVSPHAA
jgi:hypothetical protein